MQVRFLQISDLHLGGGVSPALDLGDGKVARLRQAPLAALQAACALARSEAVEAILIPGDLFDAESVEAETINEAIACLNGVAPIPVLIAPGNHDFYSPDGYYGRDFLAGRGRSVWGDHVYIFDDGAFRSFSLKPDVRVTGACFTGNVSVEDRPLAEPLPVDPWALNILLLHGSREGIGAQGRKITCPFSDAELLAQPFDYTALGHYHAHAEIRDAGGTVRAAYAGSPQGRGLDETGEKGALLVTVAREDGGRSVSVEFRPLAQHRIHLVEIDVTGLESASALVAALETRLAAVGARWDDDVIVVRLEGRWPRGASPALPEGFAERFFHLALDRSRVVPDYDLATLERQEHTVVGAFVRSLLPRLRTEQDEARRRLLKNALYYGLDALNDETVRPRYEE